MHSSLQLNSAALLPSLHIGPSRYLSTNWIPWKLSQNPVFNYGLSPTPSHVVLESNGDYPYDSASFLVAYQTALIRSLPQCCAFISCALTSRTYLCCSERMDGWMNEHWTREINAQSIRWTPTTQEPQRRRRRLQITSFCQTEVTLFVTLQTDKSIQMLIKGWLSWYLDCPMHSLVTAI